MLYLEGSDLKESTYANDDVFYIGIENELEYAGKFPKATLRESNFIYSVGTDGSLNTHGAVEIRSNPATWEAWRSNRDKASCLWDLSNHGYAGMRSCGMHVHLSRTPMQRDAIFLIVDFVFANPFFSRWVSGREVDSTWASVLSSSHIKHLVSAISKSRYKDLDDVGRFSLAVTPNDVGTMEFRMFQGTTSEKQFWGAIEYVSHLNDLTLDKNRSKSNKISVEEFIDRIPDDKPYLAKIAAKFSKNNKEVADFAERMKTEMMNKEIAAKKCLSKVPEIEELLEMKKKLLNADVAGDWRNFHIRSQARCDCTRCLLEKVAA